MRKFDSEIDHLFVEILRALSSKGSNYVRAGEIVHKIRDRGLNFSERTVRNRLEAMAERGFVEKKGNSWRITDKGLEMLSRSTVFDRLGEFSETLEYNMLHSTFNIYTMEGTVPTSVAILDKDQADRALEVLSEVLNSRLATSRYAVLLDEGEIAGKTEIEEGKIGIGTISSTVMDIIMLNIGVILSVEYAGLLKYENGLPVGVTELINYSGTTISPGLLFIRGGYTSVYDVVVRGSGYAVIAIRNFSPYAIEEVEKEVQLASARGLGKVLTITMDRFFGIPAQKRAMLVFQAGINQLAPLYELGFKPVLEINSSLIEFRKFGEIDELI
ncbi:Uncharacterized protein conserved in archaea [Archaeoglobus sulfaticallidus PM70-1]|uniref:Uncharacterized protein conserved in archaea n=1 Tax=Archaeoglobus sulfaticallidus PM70-1 TaxID=387631 RepID=N0BK59_9EURY|nr:NrpR regulatory domain-containing protein [Archaeoglobus sulfaticallidus]AGK60891.1 Uncharacterized protein conserved in archaea [Archaeoglobus sulfaticallidus PM70-1]